MRTRNKLFPTPEDAENAFYDAFERGNIALMMAVWAETDDIVCIHPRGPRLTGFDAVRESWLQIFSGGSTLRVRATQGKRFSGQALAVHSVVELVAPAGSEASPTPVFATNIYELTEGGWRMVVHHATPAPEEQARPEEPAAPTHTLH